MAHLYTHKTHGFQIHYSVFLPNGVKLKKYKTKKKKGVAETLLAEVGTLEALSRKDALSKDEVKFYFNKKYITLEESQLLSNSFVTPYSTWNDIEHQFLIYSKKRCSEYTHRLNMIRCSNLIEWFRNEEIPPTDITAVDIENYVSAREKKVSARTVNYDIGHLRQLLDFIDPNNNPARAFPFLRVKTATIRRPLSPDELKAFLKTLKDYTEYLYGLGIPLAMIYLYAGMRPSEITRLLKTDIDFNNNKIYVQGRTKTGHARAIDIHPKLTPYLKELIAISDNERLFGDKHIHKDSVHKFIKRVMADAGLQGVTPYSLRHTFISYLLKGTRDLAYVMQQAGHQDIETTQGYIKVIADNESRINKLGY